MNYAKSLIESRTFWIAVAQAFVGAIAVFHGTYPDIGWLMVAKSSLDIFLRMQTTQPISGIVPSNS